MSVEKIDELTPIVNGLADNKASVFSYTEQAYQDNDVTGVSQYDFSKEQNIPDKNSTDTNPQVLTKGFRSQGSSIPRNFINHFIGRFSYNLNKIIDVFQSFITSYKSDYQKNGFMYNATLPYQVGDVCMDVWSDNTFAFFVRTGNGGSTGVRPMVASENGWTVSEHWSCLGTPQNTSQSFIIRDSAGRAQVATPSAANDIANKSYVDSTSSSEADAVQTNLTSHINNQASGVHGSTSAATANKLIIRDSAGRAQVATPSAASDIANKSYVDNKTWNANDITAGTLPISRGGTGASTLESALNTLRIPHITGVMNNNSGSLVHYSVDTKAMPGYTGALLLVARRGEAVLLGYSTFLETETFLPKYAWRITSVYRPGAKIYALRDLGNGVIGVRCAGYTLLSVISLAANNATPVTQSITTTEFDSGTEITLKDIPLSLSEFGVTATAAELNKLDGFTGSASKLNFTNGLTSDAQAQINALKAAGGAPGEFNPAPVHTVTSSKNVMLATGWYYIVGCGGGGGGGSGTDSSIGGGGGGSGAHFSSLFYIKTASNLDITIGNGGIGIGQNGTSTYVDYKARRIFFAGGGQGGENGQGKIVGKGGSGCVPGTDSSGNLGGRGGGSIFKAAYTAAGSTGDLGCGGGGGNAGKLGGQGGNGAVYIYRMG